MPWKAYLKLRNLLRHVKPLFFIRFLTNDNDAWVVWAVSDLYDDV